MSDNPRDEACRHVRAAQVASALGIENPALIDFLESALVVAYLDGASDATKKAQAVVDGVVATWPASRQRGPM